MLELKYDGTTITATLDGTTVTIKEVGRDTGDWTLNVVKNHLDAFGVTYRESSVVYNKDATVNLYVMSTLCGEVHLGFATGETDEWLELCGSPKLYEMFMSLGALS